MGGGSIRVDPDNLQWPLTPISSSWHFLKSNISKNGAFYGQSYYRIITSLSNSTTFNVLEWPLTWISRSRYFSTLNISEMTRNRAVVTIEVNRISYAFYRMVTFPVTLMDPWPDFQGHIIFEVKYLECLLGKSFYRKRMGNHSQSIEWYHFQWPWVISYSDFKVTTFCSRIVLGTMLL